MNRSLMKMIGKILLIFAAVLLVAIIIFVTRDNTVDFSGTVTKITKDKTNEVTYVISAINGELSILADSKTEYTLYPDQEIYADYVSIGDTVTGDYRRFKKEYAKSICVTAHRGAIQNKQYAYDSIVYSVQPSNSLEKKHIAIEGENNILSQYNYTTGYTWEYHSEGKFSFKKDVLTEKSFDNCIKDKVLAKSIRNNNLNTFAASGTYLLEQKNGDIYYFSKTLSDGDINIIYKLKEVGDIISVEDITLKKDIETYYNAVCSGADKMPEFQMNISNNCRSYLEGKFAYQRDTVKWLGQKMDKLQVDLERAVKKGDVIFYTATASFKYVVQYATDHEMSHTDRIYILVDSKDDKIIDWYVSGNQYEMEQREAEFDITDTSTWLENIVLNKTKKFIVPVLEDTLSPKPNPYKTYISYNKDAVVTEVMGLDFQTVYDPNTDSYIINNDGMGQPKAIEKIEVANTHIKLWFTKGSTLHAWMTDGESLGSIDVNQGYHKQINGRGEAYYQSYREHTPSTVTFGEQNGQNTMTFQFNEPTPEPITEFSINSGKVD